MDDSRWDDLARDGGTTRSRRETIAALLGGGLVAELGRTALTTEAAAKKRARRHNRQRRRKKRQTGRFVQSFCAGTLTPATTPGESDILTLTGGLGWTLHFPDRPARQAGVARTEDMLAALAANHGDPLTATLVPSREVGDGVTEPTIWVLTLLHGSYETATGTVTYQVRIVPSAEATRAGVPVASADPPTGPVELEGGSFIIHNNTVRTIRVIIVRSV